MEIDFKAVKTEFPILKVCDLLGITLKRESNPDYYRGDCPFCQTHRTFRVTVTRDKQMWGCFRCRDDGVPDCRGDQLELVKKMKGLKDALAAAKWLAGDDECERERQEANRAVGGNVKEPGEGMAELTYLEHDHPDVELLGFDPEDAKRIGVGFAPKGTMRGQVIVPIRLKSGACVGYIGVSEVTLPREWRWPDQKIVPLRRKKV